MRKFLLTIFAVTLLAIPSFAVEDDSTPYNPYPEPQPQTQTQTQKKAPAKKKTPAKKTSTKKKTTTAKKTPSKKTPAKVSAPKPSSLQQAINLMEQGNYEQAKRYLLHAINVNRNDPNVWYWYGKYHEYTGNFYQAQFYYSKAVKIDPAFEKLSRVVYYPNDPDKIPLWDPKRPARVYPVETSGRGITTIAPDAIDRITYPKATEDPELPKVPVYTPPQPGSSPLEGDAWAPPVYVPPTPEDYQAQEGRTPVYVPPANSGIIADGSSVYQEVTEIVKVNQETEGQPAARDNIVRADKPLYNPPEPGQQKVTPVKTQTQKKTQTQPAKKTTTTTKKKETKKAAPVKTVKKQSTPARTRTQTQTQTPRVQTQTPSQTRTPTPAPETRQPTPQPQPQTQREQPRTQTTPAPAPTQTQRQERESRQESRQQQQYMPPVGQYAPDPGTISETPPPPVGQGNI